MEEASNALLQPITVSKATLPNRVVMGSMHTGFEYHPERFDELARFYAELARGGVGLIVTAPSRPARSARPGRPCDRRHEIRRGVDAKRAIAEGASLGNTI